MNFTIIKAPYGDDLFYNNTLIGKICNGPNTHEYYSFPIIDPLTSKKVGAFYRVNPLLSHHLEPSKVIMAPFQILYTTKHSAKRECHICGSAEDLVAMPSIAYAKKFEPKFEAHVPFEESANRYFCERCRDTFEVSLELPKEDIFGNNIYPDDIGYYYLDENYDVSAMANINMFITSITQIMINMQRGLPDDQKKQVLCPLLKSNSLENSALFHRLGIIIGNSLRMFYGGNAGMRALLEDINEGGFLKKCKKDSRKYYTLMMRLWEIQAYHGTKSRKGNQDVSTIYMDLCKLAEMFPRDLNIMTLSLAPNEGIVYKKTPPVHLKKEWVDKVIV